jgi:hypothetical protein
MINFVGDLFDSFFGPPKLPGDWPREGSLSAPAAWHRGVEEREAAEVSGIRERMAEAQAKMIASKRFPKAYYLTTADMAEFMATDPPTITVPWGNNPVKLRDDPAFDGVPVRETTANGEGQSRLYNTRGSSRALPD